jgi:hypothetical protein
LTPPLVSRSWRHPFGGIENEIASPLQSNISRGRSRGEVDDDWSGSPPGVELHAGPVSMTRARQAASRLVAISRSNRPAVPALYFCGLAYMSRIKRS